MNIFVGCSARDTNNEEYNKVAINVGNFIVNRKCNLLFGGCEHGLMGKVYSAVTETESEVIIVISKSYLKDMGNLKYDDFYLCDTVNERKDKFIELADAMIFLPGGLGTVDELLTAIESKRNHQHDLPIVIINVNNYFVHLLNMLEKIYTEEFADSKNRSLYFVANSLEEAMEYLDEYA